MTTQDNGGPAFPVSDEEARGKVSAVYGGMTMRDYFAAKALAGMLACDVSDFEDEQMRRDDYSEFCKGFATSAYQMADAMLEARK